MSFHRSARTKPDFAIAILAAALGTRIYVDSATLTEPKEVTFTLQAKPATQTVYRAAEFRGLKIQMLPGETRSLGKDKADNAFLRSHEKGALEFLGRDTQIGERPEDRDRLTLPVCEILRGNVTAPHGQLPVPPVDAAVEPPIVPFGAYLKVECNDDDAVLGTLLRATFHQLRKLHMNTVVLMRTGSPVSQPDLAQEYGLKAVVRLHRIGGAEQEAMMRHPAVLTYMIGDEPRFGPKLDAHIAMFAEVTKKYPQFKPVTCTIFDAWGTGDESDPDRIHNDHLSGFDRWGTHSHQSGIVQGMLFDGRTIQIANQETLAAMQAFGKQFTRIKPVLRAFTPALIPVHRSRPFALDVQARANSFMIRALLRLIDLIP